MNITQTLFQALEKQKAGELELAKKLYGEVLQADLRNADAHHLLGCIYAQEKKIDEAIASIGAAVSILPKQATFYNSLGTCYKDKREWVAAELCYKQALALDQAYGDAWANWGSLLINSHRFAEALTELEKAVSLAPRHENILCNLGWCYVELARVDDALDAYRNALQAFPNSILASLGMAVCLNKLNRPGEAIAMSEHVLKLSSRYDDMAYQFKGNAYEFMGKFDEALQCYDAGLRANPVSTNLISARVGLKKITVDDPFFKYLQSLEGSAAKLQGTQRAQMFYSLGKAYLDTGDVATAARHYAIGASAQLLNSRYREEDEAVRNANIVACVTEQALQLMQNQGSESDRPIFILGMPRSGTTLVEQILGSHSAVAPIGELTFVNEALDGMFIPGGWKLDNETAHKLPVEATLKQRAEAYMAKVDAFSPTAVNRRFTDKMPANYLNLGLILAMFPNARIIHCRRDPVDTCISCYVTLFASKQYWSYDFGVLGRTFRRYWNLMEYWRKVLPGRFLEVRYEQVVDDTESAARQLLEWCNLEWEPQVLKFHETKRQVLTASVTQVRQPIYKSSVGRWKKWEPYIHPLLAEIGDLERQYWAEVGL